MNSFAPLAASTAIVRAPDQVSGDIEGRVVLLSIQNGEYYDLNEIGSRIWQLIEKPITIGALVDRLVEEFEVERPRCEAETLNFLQALLKDNLARIEGGTG